jgi:hypothetical protein
VNWSFGAGDSSRTKASALDIDTSKTDLEAAKRELDHYITSIYPTLKSRIENNQKSKIKYDDLIIKINKFMSDIDAGNPVDFKDGLDLLGNFNAQWYGFTQEKSNILDTKYTIQKKIGTLFDYIKIN